MMHMQHHRAMMQVEAPHAPRTMQCSAMPRHLCFGSHHLRHRNMTTSCLRPQQEVYQSTTTETTTSQPITGLPTEYCDDFVCNSSPAVESTIRTVVRWN